MTRERDHIFISESAVRGPVDLDLLDLETADPIFDTPTPWNERTRGHVEVPEWRCELRAYRSSQTWQRKRAAS